MKERETKRFNENDIKNIKKLCYIKEENSYYVNVLSENEEQPIRISLKEARLILEEISSNDELKNMLSEDFCVFLEYKNQEYHEITLEEYQKPNVEKTPTTNNKDDIRKIVYYDFTDEQNETKTQACIFYQDKNFKKTSEEEADLILQDYAKQKNVTTLDLFSQGIAEKVDYETFQQQLASYQNSNKVADHETDNIKKIVYYYFTDEKNEERIEACIIRQDKKLENVSIEKAAQVIKSYAQQKNVTVDQLYHQGIVKRVDCDIKNIGKVVYYDPNPNVEDMQQLQVCFFYKDGSFKFLPDDEAMFPIKIYEDMHLTTPKNLADDDTIELVDSEDFARYFEDFQYEATAIKRALEDANSLSLKKKFAHFDNIAKEIYKSSLSSNDTVLLLNKYKINRRDAELFITCYQEARKAKLELDEIKNQKKISKIEKREEKKRKKKLKQVTSNTKTYYSSEDKENKKKMSLAKTKVQTLAAKAKTYLDPKVEKCRKALERSKVKLKRLGFATAFMAAVTTGADVANPKNMSIGEDIVYHSIEDSNNLTFSLISDLETVINEYTVVKGKKESELERVAQAMVLSREELDAINEKIETDKQRRLSLEQRAANYIFSPCGRINYIATFSLTQSELDTFDATVQHEGGDADAPYVTSTIANRADVGIFGGGNNPYAIVTAPGQFQSYFDGYYLQYANGKYSDSTRQIVEAILSGEVQPYHDFLYFTGKRPAGVEGVDYFQFTPGGNYYYGHK